MAQVTVTINGREYQVACQDGQEAHLTRLAQYVDRRVGELVASVGQLGDTRLLVMASLLVADELTDARAELESLRAGNAGDTPEPASGTVQQEALCEGLETLAERIEAVAARLEET